MLFTERSQAGRIVREYFCGVGNAPVGSSNSCCSADHIYMGKGGTQACCPTPLVNGQCVPAKSNSVQPQCAPNSTDPNCCAAGYKWTGASCCLASQLTTAGQCCPAGQIPSGPNKSQCKPDLKSEIPPYLPRRPGDDQHGRSMLHEGNDPDRGSEPAMLCDQPGHLHRHLLSGGPDPGSKKSFGVRGDQIVRTARDHGQRRLLPKFEFLYGCRRAGAVLRPVGRSANEYLSGDGAWHRTWDRTWHSRKMLPRVHPNIGRDLLCEQPPDQRRTLPGARKALDIGARASRCLCAERIEVATDPGADGSDAAATNSCTGAPGSPAGTATVRRNAARAGASGVAAASDPCKSEIDAPAAASAQGGACTTTLRFLQRSTALSMTRAQTFISCRELIG